MQSRPIFPTGLGPKASMVCGEISGVERTAAIAGTMIRPSCTECLHALTVIAMGPRGSMLHAPDVYMEKLAIGPGYPQGLVTLDMPVATRISALATEKGCAPKDITVCILER